MRKDLILLLDDDLIKNLISEAEGLIKRIKGGDDWSIKTEDLEDAVVAIKNKWFGAGYYKEGLINLE